MPMKTRDQAERRRTQTTMDQHGRRWSGTIEIDSGVYTGPLAPEGWTAPRLVSGVRLLPPPNYFAFDVQNPGQCVIREAEWLADTEAAERSREARRIEWAKKMFPSDVGRALQENPAELVAEVGPGPVIPSAMIRACIQGNAYALGKSPNMPEWAVPYCAPVDEQGATTASTARRTVLAGPTEFPDAPEDAREDGFLDEAPVVTTGRRGRALAGAT